MYECKSIGLSRTIEELRANYIADVDCILINESHWIGKKHPCIVYGTRGVCYFEITVTGANRSLASGDFGGIVHEPMADLLLIIQRFEKLFFAFSVIIKSSFI